MLSFLAAFGVASASQFAGADQADFSKFQEFVSTHSKQYASVGEYAKKFGAFREFLKLADERNMHNVAAGGEDNVHGITKFADLTQQEFTHTYLMKPGFYKAREDSEEAFVPAVNMTAGDVDWRNQGVVTAVKDQGQCGSCWAFSATEATESFGQLDVNYGLTPLSTQQACSCTYLYNGCNGGNPQSAYKNAMENYGGEESGADYPYTVNCATCAVTNKQKYVSTSGYTNVPKGNNLQDTLDKTGPPSVAVAAETWNTYKGGVVVDCPGSIDHAVQAVGYTSSGVTTPYFIVRNSWGTSWGNAGYIYLAMSGDTCLVQDDINYPHAVAV